MFEIYKKLHKKQNNLTHSLSIKNSNASDLVIITDIVTDTYMDLEEYSEFIFVLISNHISIIEILVKFFNFNSMRHK